MTDDRSILEEIGVEQIFSTQILANTTMAQDSSPTYRYQTNMTLGYETFCYPQMDPRRKNHLF
jgi:hypothetical protein